MTFSETYHCKADAKGRIALPAGLRSILEPVMQEGLVLKRSVFSRCIELYPKSEWDVIMQKMKPMNPFERKNRDFFRKFTADVRSVEIDASGRFLIPKNLFDFAGINKNVVLASAINFIEIWDEELYEQEINKINDEEFASLTEEVMRDGNTLP